jgi:hypothetical protein
VNSSAQQIRLRPVSASNSVPMRPKSTWHRRTRALRPPAHLVHVALHGAQRDSDPSTLQELVDLDRVEVVPHPDGDLVVVVHELPPRLAVTVDAMRPHRLDDLSDEHIGELAVAATPVQTQHHRRLHVAADRLAVDLGQPLDRAEPLPGQPQPQHFSDLLSRESARFAVAVLTVRGKGFPWQGSRPADRAKVPSRSK